MTPVENNLIENASEMNSKIVPVSLAIIATILVMVALYFMKTVLLPFVFSIFVYFLISPLIDMFTSRFKLPRWLSIIITIIGLIIIVTVLVTLVGISLRTFIRDSDIYLEKLLNTLDEISLMASNVGVRVDLSIIRETIINFPVLGWLQRISSEVVTVAGNLFLIVIFNFFLLATKSEENQLVDDGVQRQITRYITTKFVVSILTALLVGVILTAFGVQLAFMFAFLTFLLNFIPNLGSVVSSLLPLPVVFLQFGYGWQLITIMTLIASTQVIIGNVVDPKLMGDSLGLHPVVILLSLLLWGFLWGVPGMFLAVPLTAIIKLALGKSKSTRPIACIMEGKFRV